MWCSTRAAQVGLSILKNMQGVSEPLQRKHKLKLEPWVGIHTGLGVVQTEEGTISLLGEVRIKKIGTSVDIVQEEKVDSIESRVIDTVKHPIVREDKSTTIFFNRALLDVVWTPAQPGYWQIEVAIKASEIYRRATPEFDEELAALVGKGEDPLATEGFVRVRTVDESKALNERREPAVIVAASGR